MVGSLPEYWLTRFVFQRALALVYLIAFAVVVHQFRPLLGEKGLLPVPQFVKEIPFLRSPSLFFFFPTDAAFTICGWIGMSVSTLALLGLTERFGTHISMIAWFGLWLLYLSFVNVGQTFYAFGWETMLLETGFLTIFLGASDTAPPAIVIWLLRWVLFRDMFGAGMIKLRGDSCWRDLTCLFYHYETQPIPNPLSWYFHWLPRWFHKMEVLFNHFVEVIVPFFYFVPKPLLAALAGLLTIFFQVMLMVNGNFSFLNLLTMVLAISTFSDSILRHIIPIVPPAHLWTSQWYTGSVWALAAVVALLSLAPLGNLISPTQIMNTSFEPLHLVNTYGAFGSITRPRYEVIIEGTSDTQLSAQTKWKEYEFFGKPGDVARRPAQIAPYHLRLDWLMWFAAFSPIADDDWFYRLIAKLLDGDKPALGLLRYNPFPDTPPHYIRVLRYEYHFTTPAERKQTGHWWQRTLVNVYLPATSLR